MEAAMPAATVEALSAMGHRISLEAPEAAFGFGGAQLVARGEAGTWIAASDHRKDGQAVGF